MIDHERALLGAVLQGYRDLPGLARIVSGPEFAEPRHEQIWQAAVKVDAGGDHVNPLAVMDAMGAAAHKLPGGATYLSDLLADCPVAAQAPHHADKVHEAAVRRQIAQLGQRCQQMLTDPDLDPADMVGRIQQLAGDVQAGRKTARVDLRTVMEKVVDIAERGETRATATPWPDLNDKIGGWYPGHLIIVGARPGTGKTMLLENAASRVLQSGRRVAFISLEMSGVELAQRMTAQLHGIELNRLRYGRGNMTEAAWEKLTRAVDAIPSLPLDLYDSKHQTMADIRALAWESKREAARHGQDLGLVVVDYLQLIQARDVRLSRQQQVGEFSRGLKALAGELEVPVMAAAQLNRQNEARAGKLPVLSDLREAGDIEQDADLVILMHEQFEEYAGRMSQTGEVDLIVAKWRHGGLGVVTVRKFGEYGRLAA